MRAWPARSCAAGQSCAADQRGEGLADVVVQQPGSRGGYQQRAADRTRELLVTQPPVALQRRHRARVQRDLPPLTELGRSHDEQSGLGVEVLVIEPDDLTDAHPGDGEQADQRLDRRGPQRGPQPLGLGQQRRDVGVGVQVGHRAAAPGGQQSDRRDLGGRVERAQVGGETTDYRHAVPQPAWTATGGQPHPGHRVGHGDRARLPLLQINDELGQQLRVAGEAEPQAAPQGQVVGQRCLQPGHDTPGQGRASSRNAPVSTLA